VPPSGLFEHSSNPTGIDRIVCATEAARRQVDPDGADMFDVHGALPAATLIQLANAIEPYDVLIIEEPAVPGNIDVFRRIKAAVCVPLIDKDSYIGLPPGPGLGAEIDEKRLEEVSRKPQSYRRKSTRLRDRSIADY
jgi:L-alanine-DL-glutamate epimerase-like enolase superfamily enzyme